MENIIHILFSKNESIRNARNYMLGQVVNKGLGMLLMPLTTFLIGAVDYGQHSLYQVIISIFVILIPLGLYRGVTRFYYDEQFDTASMLGTQFAMMMITMTIMTVFLFVTIQLWHGLTQLNQLLAILMMVHCYAQSIINFYLAFLQSQKKSSKYATYSVWLAALTTIIGVFSMFFFAEERWMGLVYTNLVFRILFAIYSVIDMFPHFRFTFTKKMVREVWRFCLPLLPQMFAGVIMTSLDRYMIKEMTGYYEAGLYSFAYTFGTVVNILVYAINQTWGPEFYELMNKHNFAGIHRKVLFYFNCLLSCALCIVMFSKEVVLIFARREEYYVAYRMVPFICYGYLLFYVYSSLSNYAVFYKKTGILSIVTCVSALLDVVLNYFGIQHFGYEFAAITTVVSYLFQYYFYYFCDKKFFHLTKNHSTYFIQKALLFIVVTYLAFVGFDVLVPHLLGQFAMKLVFAGLFVILIWRDKDKFGKIELS